MDTIDNLLRLLWPGSPPKGNITIWEMPGKKSYHFPLSEFLGASAEDIEELLEQLEGHDVYFGHSLREDGLDADHRGTKKECTWSPGYVLDIDVFNPATPEAHKATLELPRTMEDVEAILGTEPVPTAIVHTGNGYHAYWRFEEPLQLTCKAERDAAHKQFEAFQQVYIDRAAELGFHLDKTASIDRVWRVPGSRNQKGQQ